MKHIEYFFFFMEICKNPCCADGEAHSPEWCEGECSERKWLLPLVAEFQKQVPNEARKCFFVKECLKGQLVAEKLFDLYIWERPRNF